MRIGTWGITECTFNNGLKLDFGWAMSQIQCLGNSGFIATGGTHGIYEKKLHFLESSRNIIRFNKDGEVIWMAEPSTNERIIDSVKYEAAGWNNFYFDDEDTQLKGIGGNSFRYILDPRTGKNLGIDPLMKPRRPW